MLAFAEKLDLGYAERAVVENVAFQLRAGDRLAVIGHNGSGKSTFVKTLLGVLPALRGRIDWPGGRPAEIGYLGQLEAFDRRFPVRLRDLAAMGAWRGLGFYGAIDRRARRRIEAALEQVGVADIADAPLHTLSGGQFQRALFARVIVQDAPLILLDEPFSAVDQRTEATLLEVINAWAAEGRAVVMVLHDLSAALERCDAALLIGEGRARFGPPAQTLSAEALVSHGYMTAAQADWMARAIGAGRAAEGGHA